MPGILYQKNSKPSSSTGGGILFKKSVQIEQASSISPQAKMAQIKDARLEPKGASFTPGDYTAYKNRQTPVNMAPVKSNNDISSMNIIDNVVNGVNRKIPAQTAPIDIRQSPVNRAIKNAGTAIATKTLDLMGRPVNAVTNAIKESGGAKLKEYGNIGGKLYPVSNTGLQKKDVLGAFAQGLTGQAQPQPLEIAMSKQRIADLSQKAPAYVAGANFVLGTAMDPTTYIGGGTIKGVISKLKNGGKAVAKVDNTIKTEKAVQNILDREAAAQATAGKVPLNINNQTVGRPIQAQLDNALNKPTGNPLVDSIRQTAGLNSPSNAMMDLMNSPVVKKETVPTNAKPLSNGTNPIGSLKPTGNINTLSTKEIPTNGAQTGNAVWKNKSFDQPVNVTGDLGTINGRRYVKVEGSNTGVPLDEIKYGNGAQSVTGTSQFKTNTLKNAEWLQGDAQKVVDNVNATYGIKTDAATVEKVNQQLSNDYQGAIDRIKQNGLQSKEDSVASGIIAQNLRQEAKTTGDYTKLKDWLQTVTPEVTNTAQTLQGLSTWKTMTAEGALSKAQQVVDGVNRDLAKANPKAFKNGKNAVLSNEDIKFISNQMDKVGAMPDGYMKDMEFARVKQLIADKIPATTRDKFRGLQRLSLIGNPKTLITRNPGGNIILGAAENIKDMPGAVIDAITSKIRGSARTTAFNPIPKVIDQAKGFGQGIGAMAKDVKYGVDTSPTRGMMELPQGRIFKSPVLNALDNVERKVLQLGDRPFYQGAYNSRINELMKLNKVTAPTEEMIQEAKLYALDRVFQNNSALSKWAGNLRRSSGIIGDLVMPFTQTPANVLDKLIDYTPGGFIKGMAQIGKNAKTGIFDQKLFVDRLARSLTGAGITMVGYTMAKNGMVTGSVPTDKDATAFQKSLGWQPYSIKIGDKYYSYNWAQPIAGLIAAGVDAYNAGKDKKDLLSQIGAGTTAAANTIINQSFLQGVVQMMSGYSPVAGFTNSMLSTPTQAAPTAGNQIRQLTDPYQRETYSPNALQKSANAVINRVPFASATLPKKVDVMGNDVKNFQGNNNAWNVMLNPGFTTTYNPNATQAEIMRLYNESGLNVQIPTVAPKSVKWQGQTYQFTPQEFTQYQTTLGQQTMDAYNKVMATPEYQQASDPDKAKMLQSAISDAKSNATFEVLQGRGLVHNPLVLSMPSSLTKNKIPIKLTYDQQAALADAISAKQQKFKDFYKAAYTDKRAAEARTKAEKEFGRTLK